MATYISQNKFSLAEFQSNVYVAEPSYGETLAQLMEPSYWKHIAAQLKSKALIRVMPEGLPYYAELIVVHAEPTRAVVKLIHFVDLADAKPLPEQAPMITEADIGNKFRAERVGAWVRIVRKADGEVMKTGFRTMALAETWARENLQVELSA